MRGGSHVRDNFHNYRLGFISIFMIANNNLNRFKRGPNKRRNLKNDVKMQMLMDILNSEASCAKGARAAPSVRKFCNPSMREIWGLVMTSLSVRPYVCTQHERKTNTNCTLKYVKTVLPPRLFGGKLHGQLCCRPRFVWREGAWPTAFWKDKKNFEDTKIQSQDPNMLTNMERRER